MSLLKKIARYYVILLVIVLPFVAVLVPGYLVGFKTGLIVFLWLAITAGAVYLATGNDD